MQVSRSKPASVLAMVGTGDGPSEFPILEAIYKAYNGKSGLWFPKLTTRVFNSAESVLVTTTIPTWTNSGPATGGRPVSGHGQDGLSSSATVGYRNDQESSGRDGLVIFSI